MNLKKDNIIALLEGVLNSKQSKISNSDKSKIRKAIKAAKKNEPTSSDKNYWDTILDILKALGIISGFFDD